jgi:prepilin-type N-terminal cleavage/methylation domain
MPLPVHTPAPGRRAPLSPRAAFTLIELLTVIAIIGVLAAILIPVVGRVRQSARTAHCIKNLQNIGAAFQLYAADNKGLYPALRWRSQDADRLPSSQLNPSTKGWQIEISPYLARDIKTFGELRRSDADAYAFCPEYLHLYRDDPRFSSLSAGGYGMNVKTPAGDWSARFRASGIRNPSQTILVGDSVDYFIDIGSGWKADPGDSDSKPGFYTNGDPERHSHRAAYVFYDGHVSILPPDTAQELLKNPL